MSKLGRNDPCPCGSGKKYKQCCLRRSTEDQRLLKVELEALPKAQEWLLDRYQEELGEAMTEGFFGSLDKEERARLDEISESLMEMVQHNLSQWLITDSLLEIDGEKVAPIDLVLGPGGPLLRAEQRAYLEHLRSRPLCVYEVLAVSRGEGLSVKDVLGLGDPKNAWVVEHAATKTLREGDLLGARLIWVQGHWELAGGIYPIQRTRLIQLRRSIEALKKRRLPPREERSAVALAIVHCWLEAVAAPPPRLIDASTGEALLLVTDHYEVVDWQKLEAALGEQHDVEGGRAENGWVRLAPQEKGDPGRRTWLAINLVENQDDRIEVFARTQTLADEGRDWFGALAGDSVRFLQREISDPAQTLEAMWRGDGEGDEDDAGEKMAREPGFGDLPDAFSEQAVMEHAYRGWADQPVPALGGKTPRQAIKTAKGKRAVVDLLRSYEEFDHRGRRSPTGQSTIDYSFLWRSLGLERSDFLR